MDKIYINGMEFYGYHGVLNEEKKLGQKFIVDVEIYCNLKEAEISDNIDDTISYVNIYEIIKNIVENRQFNLLEKLAGEICKEIKLKVNCKKVKVKINKPNAPINGIFSSIGVEIER